MSLGSVDQSSIEQSTINALVADGVTVVAAAGNQNQDACDYNPTWTPWAITVASYPYGWGRVLVEKLINYSV